MPEDAVLTAARGRALEVGCPPVEPGAGAALRLLAAAAGARTVVELGTGVGVSGLWLLRGMRPDGTLTTVDIDSEHQRLARQAFTEAGFAGGRVRLISGAALEVLPRLSDGSYDLLFCHAAVREYPDYLTEGLRLLRPGGVIAFADALWRDRVPDPAARDPDSVVMREFVRTLRTDERLVAALLPVGGGLLAATRP